MTTVEIKDVEIPEAMQRAMARAAEAERERRAKIISAEGEFQASQKLLEASEVLSRNPAAMQLRYQQTLVELGGEKSTIVFPLPLDLIAPFITGAHNDDNGADDTKPGSRHRVTVPVPMPNFVVARSCLEKIARDAVPSAPHDGLKP